MDMSGFTGSNFITAEFLEFLGPNVRIETKIVSAGLREFAEGDKPVIFVDYQAKAVVLNPTRAKVLCSAYGLESANWIGRTVIISRGETTYSGKKTGCVEIEAVGGQRIGVGQRRAITGGHDARNDNGAPVPPVIDFVPDGPGESDDIPF